MSSIHSKNTQPEIIIRKILWNSGIRYRIHDKTIFGTPDISNKKRKIAIFLDGCFWHGCGKCYVRPKTNTEFWKNKITNNKKRRSVVSKQLKNDGWNILEFWEHDIRKSPESVSQSIMDNWHLSD